jgi:hypothetical protein
MKIWSNWKGLGDILLLTIPCKYRDDITILLPKKLSKYSFLFDNIADVHLVKEVPEENCFYGEGSNAERLLSYCDLKGFNALPKIDLSSKSINEAKKLFPNGTQNHIILKPNCSINFIDSREQPKSYWEYYSNLNKESKYILTGLSKNITIPSFINKEMLDLDLPILAAIYSLIGKYVGVDTGDMHLMLAVGGECEVHIPPDGYDYSYKEWHYDDPKVKYVTWNSNSLLKKKIQPTVARVVRKGNRFGI